MALSVSFMNSDYMIFIFVPGGLLAAAISRMNGTAGKPGWAWIFILEGLVTVVLGLASYWIIQDFPDKAKFLNETERKLLREEYPFAQD